MPRKSLRPRYIYAAMQEDIIQAIRRGELKPGDRIKSIDSLSAQYGIAKRSVHKGVLELAARNLLISKGVRGTFVADDPFEHCPSRLRNAIFLMAFGSDPYKRYVASQFRLGAMDAAANKDAQFRIYSPESDSMTEKLSTTGGRTEGFINPRGPLPMASPLFLEYPGRSTGSLLPWATDTEPAKAFLPC